MRKTPSADANPASGPDPKKNRSAIADNKRKIDLEEGIPERKNSKGPGTRARIVQKSLQLSKGPLNLNRDRLVKEMVTVMTRTTTRRIKIFCVTPRNHHQPQLRWKKAKRMRRSTMIDQPW